MLILAENRTYSLTFGVNHAIVWIPRKARGF